MAATKRLTGYRFVEILHGDTLQAIAARELGDAGRWVDLITINGLAHPYLTGDTSLAGEKVKLYGQQIIVPAGSAQVSAASDPERVFGTDLILNQGLLEAENGDLRLVSGRANLRQAILHRVRTALAELLFHRTYGCGVHGLIGKINGPTAGVLGAQYVRGALLADPRISSVPATTATISGDRVEVSAVARSISGTTVDIQASV